MTRTIVDIPAAQLVEIDRLCRLMGISRAEAVRRALATFAQGHVDVTPEAFGLWASRGAGTGLAPDAPERPTWPGQPEVKPRDDLQKRSARR